jgi:hypothetical protein
VDAGATVIPVEGVVGFSEGQSVSIDTGANAETAVIQYIHSFGGASITFRSPLNRAHAKGAMVCGTGITLSTALTREHPSGTPVAEHAPTPGELNQYRSRPQ